ncbi:hypothetical protein R6Q59_033479 [Mikania micrantha]
MGLKESPLVSDKDLSSSMTYDDVEDLSSPTTHLLCIVVWMFNQTVFTGSPLIEFVEIVAIVEILAIEKYFENQMLAVKTEKMKPVVKTRDFGEIE